MPYLLLFFFPDVVDSKALFLPTPLFSFMLPSSLLSSLPFPSPFLSPLLASFLLPLPSPFPSPSCVPSLVSAPVPAPFPSPSPSPSPFPTPFPSPFAPARHSDLVPPSVQCACTGRLAFLLSSPPPFPFPSRPRPRPHHRSQPPSRPRSLLPVTRTWFPPRYNARAQARGLANGHVGCPQASLSVCRDYVACGMNVSAVKQKRINAEDVPLTFSPPGAGTRWSVSPTCAVPSDGDFLNHARVSQPHRTST